jgi:hypothetical protein
LSDTTQPVTQGQAYFANLEGEDLGKALFDRIVRYENYVYECGLFNVWRLSYLYWYSQDEEGFTAHLLGRKGPRSKYVVLKLNHYRSIVKNWRTLAQAQRAASSPVARFNDSSSDAAVKRARVVLKHYAKASKIDELKDEAIDISSYLGAAHLEQCWYDQGGEMVLPGADPALIPGAPPPTNPDVPQLGIGPQAPNGMMQAQPPGPPPPGQMTVDQTGAPSAPLALQAPKPYGGDGNIYTGTIETHVYSPIDFIVDPFRMDHRAKWCITRRYENKYDIAALHAKDDATYSRIIGLTRPKDEKLRLELGFAHRKEEYQTDDIPVFTFWHEKTPACPQGRKVTFLASDLILKVENLGKLPRIPIQRIAPANIRRTPFGYSEAWDLLAPQRALDILNSISLSNIRTFGAGNVLAPKGSGLKATQVTEGLNLLEYNPVGEKPSALAVPQTPREVYDAKKIWVGEMGTLIGVNSVARGDPEKSLESGSALALVQAQAVQYSSDYQGEIVTFEGEVDTDTVRLVNVNLKQEVEFAVVGDEIATLEKFDGHALDPVMRVDLEPVSPMTKTLAGRWQIVDLLSQRYPNKITPEQVIRFVGTGTLDPVTEDSQSESRNILRENELLSKGIGPPPKVPVIGPDGQPVIGPDGKPQMQAQPEPGKQYVRALLTDNPYRHTAKHIALLDSPAARANPQVYNAVLAHLSEHEELYAFLTANRPGLLQMLQIEPMQAAIPPQMPMAPGASGPPPEGAGGPPAGVRPPPAGPSGGDGTQAPPNNAQPAKMPQFPKNPSTGERFQPPPPPGG